MSESDLDLDLVASLTMKDASTGVVLAICVVLMFLPFVFLALALLPDRTHHEPELAPAEEPIR